MANFWDDQEYFGSSFISIIEPDITIRATKKNIMYNAKLDLGQFNKEYWNWKHEYRKKYSEDKMISYGYKPIVGGASADESISNINEFMLGKDPNYGQALSTKTGYTDLYSTMANYLQWNGYAYSIKKQELNIDGTIYNYNYVGYLENPDPSLPDDYTVGVGTFTSPTGSVRTINFPNAFSGKEIFQVLYIYEDFEIESSEYYIFIDYIENVPFEVSSENSMVISAIVPIKERGIILEETSNMRLMLRKMGVKQDDFEEILEKQIENEDDLDVTETEAVDNAYVLNGLSLQNPYEILAKEYDSDAASQYLSGAFMRELDRQGFYEETGEGVGTYTVTAEVADEWRRDHYREQAYLAKALFMSFAYYANLINMDIYNSEGYSLHYVGNSVSDFTTSGVTGNHWYPTKDADIYIRSGWLFAGINFNISVVTKNGIVRADEGVIDKRAQADFHFSGTRTSREDDEGERIREETWDSEGYDKLVIKAQKNETQYQEMTIIDYGVFYDFEDTTFWTNMGYTKSESRMILPHFVMQDLRFTEFVTVNEHSFCVYAYAKTVVEFDVVGFIVDIIVGIALSFIAGPAGWAHLIGTIVKAVVIAFLMAQLYAMIDNEIIKMAIGIAMTLYGMYTSTGFDLSSITAENFLPLANQVYNISQKVDEIIKVDEIKQEREDERNIETQEGLDEKISGMDEMMTIVPKMNMGAHYSYAEANSPDAYYASVYESLYNFDQFYNVDGEVELRKQVVSG